MTPVPVSGGRIVLTADGGGDELLGATPGSVLDFLPYDVSVRPVVGGADELAPVAGAGLLAVSAPSGRAAALLGQSAAGANELTVWRP